MSVRVGLASLDGARVDQHFGSARVWQIYDVGEDAGDPAVFVEQRKTRPGCDCHSEGGFASQLETLADCGALFVSRIGEGAALAMLQKGKRVFEAEGPVEGILGEAVRQGLLKEGN